MSKKNKKNVEVVNETEEMIAGAIMDAEELTVPPVQQEPSVESLLARIAELEAKVASTPRSSGSVRKTEVLSILREGPAGIKAIAAAIGVNTRNVSSILNGLKKDGYVFHTDEQHRKYLVSEPDMNPTPSDDEPAE